jgi:DNA-binding IclR family transcriptional regulator
MNQHRIMRVIKLIAFLQERGRHIHTIARYLGISERSVYRYLKMYEQLGYYVEKDINKKYFIK